MKTFSRIRRAFNRVRAIWSELDYAQQRLFEIRTGVDVIDRSRWPSSGR